MSIGKIHRNESMYFPMQNVQYAEVEEEVT